MNSMRALEQDVSVDRKSFCSGSGSAGILGAIQGMYDSPRALEEAVMITPGPGAVIARRYTLTRLLGRGGMGSVWLARHRDLEIDVAVKFMAPALVASPEARMRFEREAKVAAPLGSQHVVQIHDYGVEDDTPYIIMEVLKGESLSARLARQKRLSPPVAARLLVQICKALRAAHDAGLVHRDLKPGNIFLALKDEEEVVKILDFGIAKSAGLGEASLETATGMMLGSAHYMSPEQIRSSKQVDHRSDLWSVGIILYRMLTGQLPFTGVDLGDVLVRVCTDVCARPSVVVPELPAAIDGFFERALARFPVQRFQSAMELTAAFDAAMSAPVVCWNKTVTMRRPVPTQEACASDGPRDSAPTAEWQPRSGVEVIGGAAQASSSVAQKDAATEEQGMATPPSSEVNPASISAVLVAGRRAESSPQIFAPRAAERRGVGRSLRPAAAMAAVVTLAGIAGVAMLRGPTPPSGAAAATASVSAPAPSVVLTPVVPTTVPNLPEQTSPLASPPVSVAPHAPSSAPVSPPVKPALPPAVPTPKFQPLRLPEAVPLPVPSIEVAPKPTTKPRDLLQDRN